MNIPLAEQMRPQNLMEVVGQQHLLGEKGFLRQLIERKKALSILFWGPPGTGKTTLGRLYAKAFDGRFLSLSAIFSGVQDIKKIVQEIESQPLFSKTVFLFVDEIHRFNTSQQDAFLPYLEKGTFILIGATTENPSFALNDALLSRLRVLPLHALEEEELASILSRYEALKSPLPLTEEARHFLIESAQGDGRYLLNLIENLSPEQVKTPLTVEELTPFIQKRSALYDKHRDGHYNLISALHKAVRGSDPQAALYWLTRMLEGGETPLYLARRIVRMAVEDIGLADPQALQVALQAQQVYQQLGSPEGELALAQAVVYLALSPKSNAIYTAFKQATKMAKETSHLPPPKHILNAPTALMKEMGYGKGYAYDHDCQDGFSGQGYFPDSTPEHTFYEPKEVGFERELCKRVRYFQQLRKKKQS